MTGERYREGNYAGQDLPPFGEPVIELKYLKRYGLFVEVRIWHWHLAENQGRIGLPAREDDRFDYVPGKYHWIFHSKDRNRQVSMVYEKPMMQRAWRFQIHGDMLESEENFSSARTAFSRIRECLYPK